LRASRRFTISAMAGPRTPHSRPVDLTPRAPNPEQATRQSSQGSRTVESATAIGAMLMLSFSIPMRQIVRSERTSHTIPPAVCNWLARAHLDDADEQVQACDPH
jgi:hypothetical protein